MNACERLLEAMGGKKQKLSDLFEKYRITDSTRLEIAKNERDLEMWKEKSLFDIWDFEKIDSLQGPRKRDELIRQMRAYITPLREKETDYGNFPTLDLKRPKNIATRALEAQLGFGKCPCPIDGEVTRCCKLTTLDAVMQCGFACSYCSVQAFYNQNTIEIVDNLDEKLSALEIPEGTWHIGTGQASDSLLLGDEHGTLSALSNFAKSHPDLVIELKSKSKRDVFSHPWPRNMIFTWSLNAPTVQEKEEHLTATLHERLENARRAADKGNLVGFHIHPMVHFKGWQEEYSAIAEKIEKMFRPEEICMISAGTLIFTKENLQYMRERGEATRVLEMELVPTAGKYSYPFKIKKEMFGHFFSSFHKGYLDSIFTYLCLEDPKLWLPVLGRQYNSDKEFELDMKKHYMEKINRA